MEREKATIQRGAARVLGEPKKKQSEERSPHTNTVELEHLHPKAERGALLTHTHSVTITIIREKSNTVKIRR